MTIPKADFIHSGSKVLVFRAHQKDSCWQNCGYMKNRCPSPLMIKQKPGGYSVESPTSKFADPVMRANLRSPFCPSGLLIIGSRFIMWSLGPKWNRSRGIKLRCPLLLVNELSVLNVFGRNLWTAVTDSIGLEKEKTDLMSAITCWLQVHFMESIAWHLRNDCCCCRYLRQCCTPPTFSNTISIVPDSVQRITTQDKVCFWDFSLPVVTKNVAPNKFQLLPLQLKWTWTKYHTVCQVHKIYKLKLSTCNKY